MPAQTSFVGSPPPIRRRLPETMVLDRMGSDHFAVMKIMNGSAPSVAAPLHQQPHIRDLVRSIVEGPRVDLPPVETLVRPGMSVMDIIADLHPDALPAYQRQQAFVTAGISTGQVPQAPAPPAPQMAPRFQKRWDIPVDYRPSQELPGWARRAGADLRPFSPPASLASPQLSPRGTRTSSLRSLASRGEFPTGPATARRACSPSMRHAAAPLSFERSSSAPARLEGIQTSRPTTAARARSADTVPQRASGVGRPQAARGAGAPPANGPHATRINTSLAELTAQSVQNRRTQLSGAVQTLQRDRQLEPAAVRKHLELVLSINKDTGMWSGRRLRDVNDALAIASRRGPSRLQRGSMPCNVLESFAEDLKRVDIRAAVSRTMRQALTAMPTPAPGGSPSYPNPGPRRSRPMPTSRIPISVHTHDASASAAYRMRAGRRHLPRSPAGDIGAIHNRAAHVRPRDDTPSTSSTAPAPIAPTASILRREVKDDRRTVQQVHFATEVETQPCPMDDDAQAARRGDPLPSRAQRLLQVMDITPADDSRTPGLMDLRPLWSAALHTDTLGPLLPPRTFRRHRTLLRLRRVIVRVRVAGLNASPPVSAATLPPPPMPRLPSFTSLRQLVQCGIAGGIIPHDRETASSPAALTLPVLRIDEG